MIRRQRDGGRTCRAYTQWGLMTLRAGDLAKEKEERFVNEQKHFETEHERKKRGKKGVRECRGVMGQ